MNHQIFRDLESGRWASLSPNQCPCRGGGWMLSDYDSWHKCHVHHTPSMKDPEWEPEFEGLTDAEHAEVRAVVEAEILERDRNLYVEMRTSARKAGFTGNFMKTCKANLADRGVTEPERNDWLDAAAEIAEVANKMVLEASARAEGYSCDLERRWAEDAEREKWERMHGGGLH